jgi:hypothetical protein
VDWAIWIQVLIRLGVCLACCAEAWQIREA